MNVLRLASAACSLMVALGLATSMGMASAGAQEISVRIIRVKALDKIDANSAADFYAQVTIAGETFKSEPIQDNDDIEPGWVFTKKVAGGVHNVKIAIIDKDVTKDDAVDVNRVGGKRDLDFRVHTGRCIITGFSEPYRCGATIFRSGYEKRRAEVSFVVNVR